MPGSKLTKPQSVIKKPEPLGKKKTNNTSPTKLPSPIQEQRQSKTKKAKNTQPTEEEWTLVRKALMAVLLERFVKERPETATTGQLSDTILLFHESVYGTKTSKNVKHTELNNKFKLAAKKLGISGEKSLHATLTEFENWLCGPHYRQNFVTMLTMNTDEEKWPRAFLTKVVMKFNDTTDRAPYAILGANYSTEKRKPNAAYCAWWKKIADEHQPEIHRFMQGNAAASPPSAPASAPASPPSTPASAPAEQEQVAEIMIFDISEECLFHLKLPGWDEICS